MAEDSITSFFDGILSDEVEKRIIQLITADKDDEEIIAILLKRVG